MATKPSPGGKPVSQVQQDCDPSNAAVTMDVAIGPAVRWSAKRMRQALAERDAPRVAAASMAFVDALCEKADLAFIPVKVASRRQRPVRNEGRGWTGSKSITVYLRSASKGRFMSYRMYLMALCHEFCHYYDWKALGMSRSYHTRGFYTRLAQLYQGVLDAVNDY